MYPHRIRLRGPWECTPLARTAGQASPLPAPCRVTMPCRWRDAGLGDFSGCVRFVRRFGAPRQIEVHERVWLTFAGADAAATVWLNGALLGRHEGACDPFEFDITSLLQPRNELRVDVEGSAETGGMWGEVAVEIRCTAFLRGTQVGTSSTGATARLQVSGEIVGAAERPLEVYVLLDGSTVAYGQFPAGSFFRLDSDDLEPERWRSPEAHVVRLDLVNGASIWYQIEQPFTFADQQGERGS
jgi:glycosyl hydrolase family 2